MRLIEEARLIAAEVESRAASEKLAAEKAQKEWEVNHAFDMVDNMKGELKEKVLEAARKGQLSTSLPIYSYSSTGRPSWIKYFRSPFEDYLRSEEFKFEFHEKNGGIRNSDVPPHNDSGWYVISW
jgi:hypothetical protein